ncbi:MAG: GNAT family N-acetyltransferase [Proteobacteria bacterium]|nr:GNAT family N-acetyltransferase [Pseudomonadota bacterium]
MTTKKPFSKARYSLPSCTLRHLQPEDASVLARALVSLDPWLTLEYQANGLRRYLAKPDSSLSRYAIVIDEQTTGVVCVRHPWLKGSLLELIAILPPYQRKSLGREVMKWLERESRGTYRNNWVLVSDFNQKARAFYRHLGYRETGRLEDLVKSGYDEFLLRKTLPGKDNK